MASTTVTALSPKPIASSTTANMNTATPQTPRSKSMGHSQFTDAQTPSPGNWRHPRMAEIVRRRKTSIFDASNVLRVMCNAAALLVSFIAAPVLDQYLPFISSAFRHATAFLGAYQSLPLLLLRILFIYNAYQAVRPVWTKPDELSDIPLTPSQRRLLGLETNSATLNTPKTEYITPPKYKRLTPRSQSPAWSQGRQDSELNTQRAQDVKQGNSPPVGSPLWAQTTRRNTSLDFAGAGSGSARRSSFGFDGVSSANASPNRDALRESSGIWVPGTPTPSSRGTNASVGLNSKWLYERGRSSSGSRRSFGGI